MLLLVDTYNLYHTTKTRRDGAVIVYAKLFEMIMQAHGEPTVTEQIAYIARTRSADPFIKHFNRLGFFVRLKEVRQMKSDSFDVELTIDALRNPAESVIICSSSRNLVPLIQELQTQKRTVYLYGSGIPHAIHNICVAREIPPDVLQKKETETETEPVPVEQ